MKTFLKACYGFFFLFIAIPSFILLALTGNLELLLVVMIFVGLPMVMINWREP